LQKEHEEYPEVAKVFHRFTCQVINKIIIPANVNPKPKIIKIGAKFGPKNQNRYSSII
jgi:hypothetical protein